MNIRMLKAALLSLVVSISGFAKAGIIINEVNIGSDDYFELFNYSGTAVDLSGYTALIRDEAGSFNLDLSGILAANSGVYVIAETPQIGEFDSMQNIMWSSSRNLSLSILNSFDEVVDLWAHGSTLFGVDSGATFSDTPLSLITSTTDNTLSYNRVAVTSSGTNFFASDWSAGIQTRGAQNTNQVIASVPEPSTIAIFALGIMGLASRRSLLVKTKQ